jgi:hypothetical protein
MFPLELPTLVKTIPHHTDNPSPKPNVFAHTTFTCALGSKNPFTSLGPRKDPPDLGKCLKFGKFAKCGRQKDPKGGLEPSGPRKWHKEQAFPKKICTSCISPPPSPEPSVNGCPHPPTPTHTSKTCPTLLAPEGRLFPHFPPPTSLQSWLSNSQKEHAHNSHQK